MVPLAAAAHLDSIPAPQTHSNPLKLYTNQSPQRKNHRCRCRRQPNSQRHLPIRCRWMPNPLCILLFTPSGIGHHHSFTPGASFFSLLCLLFPLPRPSLPPCAASRTHPPQPRSHPWARSIAAVLPPAEERTCQHSTACSCFSLTFRSSQRILARNAQCYEHVYSKNRLTCHLSPSLLSIKLTVFQTVQVMKFSNNFISCSVLLLATILVNGVQVIMHLELACGRLLSGFCFFFPWKQRDHESTTTGHVFFPAMSLVPCRI